MSRIIEIKNYNNHEFENLFFVPKENDFIKHVRVKEKLV